MIVSQSLRQLEAVPTHGERVRQTADCAQAFPHRLDIAHAYHLISACHRCRA
jgi:hypothetical protein